MNWACPHCFTALYVSEDRLSTSWSFARCYLCAGVSLVKRGDLNLLKIDRTPKAEPLIAADAVGAEVRTAHTPQVKVPKGPPPITLPNYLDESALTRSTESKAPAWVALMGLVLLGSGYWIYQSGSKQMAAPEKASFKMANHLSDAPKAPTEWTDRIQSRAMAPARPENEAQHAR